MALPMFPKSLARDAPRYILSLCFYRAIKTLPGGGSILHGHTNQELESGDLIGNRWFQMKLTSVGCGPVGCQIRMVPTGLGGCARLK